MKNNSLFIIGSIIFCFTIITSHDVFAVYNSGDAYSSNTACVKAETADLDEKEWACSVYDGGKNSSTTRRYCVAWIGNRDNSPLVRKAGEGDTITTYIWRMCTNTEHYGGESLGAKDLRIDSGDPYGSISFSGTIENGGPWTEPDWTTAYINVSKFIKGLNGTAVSGGTKYTRTVTLYRCNINGSGGCATQDTKISIIIPSVKYTLTAYAKSGSADNDINGGNPIDSDSKTVEEGDSASLSVTRTSFTGYTWSAWGTGGVCKDAKSNNTCTVSVRASHNVNAYYIRNAFSGRASVAEGTDWNSTTNRTHTGWKTDDGNVSIDVNCPNGGCKANFWLELRTDAGSGSTAYWTGTQKNGGTISWWPSSTVSAPITPAKSPSYTTVLGTDSNTGAPVDLKPGDSACRHLEFYPFGSSKNTVYKHLYACATAKVTTFQGKTSVSGANAGDNTTDWQNTNTSKVARITNCSSTSGCKVTFTHDMKITNAGGGSSAWSVVRESNLTTSTKGISTNRGSSASSGTFSNTASNGAQVSNSGELTLWPGMVVCETLSFRPDNNPSTTSNVYTRVCASAEGDAQPPCIENCTPDCDPAIDECSGDKDKDPTGANTLINEKVKNNDVSAYNKYQKVVYAKPGTVDNSTGDKVTYRATYNPVLQYTYHLVPQQMQIDGGTIYSPTTTNRTLGSLFNAHKGNLQKWNNAFNVSSENFSDTIQYSYNYGLNPSYGLGDMTVRKESNDHTVVGSEVGKSLNEIAKTSANSVTQTTPGQVTFLNNSGNNLGNIITTPVQSTASVLVPYNFENTTEVTRGDNEPLYAGETASIDFDITTSPKRNNVTDGTYATIVRNAEWELEVSYNGNSYMTSATVNPDSKTGDLNGSFKLAGDTTSKSININVPDVPAGTEICIRSMVKPSNSDADTNWNNPGGNGEWAYSEQKCFRVAKRPSMQVWGGNTYSNGIINMADAIKNNLAYYSDAKYQLESEGNTNKTFAFGSWTELGLVSNGAVTGLSSGASLGYAVNNDGLLWPGYHPTDGFGNNNQGGLSTADKNQNPGGSSERSLCKRSPLTFPNTCSNGFVGGLGNTVKNTEDDKKAIASTFIFGGDANIGDVNNVTLNNPSNMREGSNIYYYEGGDSALKMAENTDIAKGTIQVVHSADNIEINGNQQYADVYATLEEIPKLVVYSEKEIRIGCGVTRIDAVLIAESVLTCNHLGGDGTISSDSIQEGINDQDNSNQLKINGAVITNKLYPNRTYGAATGANSMIPAEIINFDPTLYTWATTAQTESGSGDGGGGASLDITYRRELAPRL